MRLFLLLACCLAASVNGYRGVYEYDIQSVIGAPQASEQHAVLRIKTKVQIKPHPSQSDELVVKMFNTIVALDAAQMINNPELVLPVNLLGQPLPTVQKVLRDTLSKYSITFQMRHGKVVSLKHDKRDPYWSVNIKKGLVSLLQYQPQSRIEFSANDQAVLNTTMPTTSGLCDTLFTYQKRFIDEEPMIEATAQPDFEQCVDPLWGLKYMVRGHVISSYTPEDCQGSCQRASNLMLPLYSTKYLLRSGAAGMELVSAKSTNVHSILAGRHASHGTVKLTIRQVLRRAANNAEIGQDLSLSTDESQTVRAPELLVAILPTDIPRQLSQNENIIREAVQLEEKLSAMIMNDGSINEDVPRVTHALLKLMTRMSKNQLIQLINHSAKFSHARHERSWLQCKRVMAHIIDMLPSVGTSEAFHTIMYLIEQSSEQMADGSDSYMKLVVDESRVKMLFTRLHTWKNVDTKMVKEILRVVRSSKFQATYYLPSASQRIQVFRAAWLSIGSLSNTLFVEQLAVPANNIRFYSTNNQTNYAYLKNRGKEIFNLWVSITSQLEEMLKEPATQMLAIKSLGNTAEPRYFDVLVKQFEQTSDPVTRQAIISSLSLIIKSTSNPVYDTYFWMVQTNYLSEQSYGKLISGWMQKYNVTVEKKYEQMAKMHDFILMVIRDHSQVPSVRFEALRILMNVNPSLPTLTSAVEAIRTMPDSNLRRLAISLFVDMSKRVDPCLKQTAAMLRQLLNTFVPMDLTRSSQFLVSKGLHHKAHDVGANFFIASMTPENSYIPSHVWLKNDMYVDTKSRAEFLEITVATQNLHQQLQSLRDAYTKAPINMNENLAKQIEKLRLQMADETDTSAMISVKMFDREVAFFEPSILEIKQIVKSPKKYLGSMLKPIEDIHVIQYYSKRNPTPSGLLFTSDHMLSIRPHVYIDTNLQTNSWRSASKQFEVIIRPHLHYIEHGKLSVECGPVEAATEFIYPLSITPNDIKLVASLNGNEVSLKWKRMTKSHISVLKIKTIMESSVSSIPAEMPSHIPTEEAESHIKRLQMRTIVGTEKRQWNDEWISPFFGMKTEIKLQKPRNYASQCLWALPMNIEVKVKPSSFETDSQWIELRGKFEGDVFNPESPLKTSAEVLIGAKTVMSMTEVFKWSGEQMLTANGDIKLQIRKIEDGDLSSHIQKLRIKYELNLPKYLDYDMSAYKSNQIEASDLPSMIDRSRKLKFEMKFLQSDAEKEFLKLKVTSRPINMDKFLQSSSNELRQTIPFLDQCLDEQKYAISDVDSKHTPACISLYFYLNSLSEVAIKAELKQTQVSKSWTMNALLALQYANPLVLPYLKRSQKSSTDKIELIAEVRPSLWEPTLFKLAINTPYLTNQYSFKYNFGIAPIRTVLNFYVSSFGSKRFESNECKIMSNHIRTFDDLSYTLPKSDIVREFSSDSVSSHLSTVCDMLVAKDCSSDATFFVALKQKLIDGKMHSMYTVRIFGTTIESKPTPDGEVELWVNGELKKQYSDKHVEIEQLSQGPQALYEIYSSSLGVRIIVGSTRGRVFRLQLPPSFYSRVCGMCGNNNGIRGDEFSVPTLRRNWPQSLDNKLHPSMSFIIPSKSQSVCEKVRNFVDNKAEQQVSRTCVLRSNGVTPSHVWNRVIDLRGKHYTPFSSVVCKILRRSDCDKLVVLREINGLQVLTNINKDIFVNYNDASLRLFSDSNQIKIHVTTSQETKTVSVDDLQEQPMKFKFSNMLIKVTKTHTFAFRPDTLAVQVQIFSAYNPVATIVFTPLEAKFVVPKRLAEYTGICASNTQQHAAPYQFLQEHLLAKKVSECLNDLSPRYTSHKSSCRLVPGIFTSKIETINSVRPQSLPILSRMMDEVTPKPSCPIVLAMGKIRDEEYNVGLQSVSGKPVVVLRIGQGKNSVKIVKRSRKTLSVEVTQQGESHSIRRVTAGSPKNTFNMFSESAQHAFLLFENNHLYITGMQRSDHAEIAIHVTRHAYSPQPWNKAALAPKAMIIRVITWTKMQDNSLPTIIITPEEQKCIQTGICSLTERDISRHELVSKTLLSLTSEESCQSLLQSNTLENRFCRVAVTNQDMWVTPFKIPSLQKIFGGSHTNNPKCPITLAKYTSAQNEIKMWYEQESKSKSSVGIKIKTSGGLNVLKFTNKIGEKTEVFVNGEKIALTRAMNKVFDDVAVSIKDIVAHSDRQAEQVTVRVPGVVEIYAIAHRSSTTFYFRSLTGEPVDSGVCAMSSAASVSDIFALYHEPQDSAADCQRYRPFQV